MTFGREMMGWDPLRAWVALWQLSPWIWGLARDLCSCILLHALPPLRGCGGVDGGDLPEGAVGWKMPWSRTSSRVSLLLVQGRSVLLAQLWQMQRVWHLWMPWPQLWNPP